MYQSAYQTVQNATNTLNNTRTALLEERQRLMAQINAIDNLLNAYYPQENNYPQQGQYQGINQWGSR